MKNSLADLTSKRPSRFMGWRDLVITPLVSLGILAIAGVGVWRLHVWHPLSLPEGLFVFYLAQAAVAVFTIYVIRIFFPPKEGKFEANTYEFYVYSLSSFILIVHLSLIYRINLIPPPLLKFFYKSLGTKFGRGIISIGGVVMDPHPLVKIDEEVIIEEDALVLPHAIASVGGKTILILGRVHIARGAVIGARSIVMPGAVIGENAMVNVHSVVTRNTVIPPGEIWGGSPAKKIEK